MEIRLEMAKIEADKEQKEKDRAVEMEKLGIERFRLQQEKEIKVAEAKAREDIEKDEVRILKRLGDALSQVLTPQPEDVTDLPAYFRGIELQFTNLKIPEKFQARLIHKYLSSKSRALCARLDPAVREDYTQLKDAILKEYGLSAKSFLDKFNRMRKHSSDTLSRPGPE